MIPETGYKEAETESMARRMRTNTVKLSARLEDEIPELICTPDEDSYQITGTLLKKDGISFELLTGRMQKHISSGYLELKEYDELVNNIRDLL